MSTWSPTDSTTYPKFCCSCSSTSASEIYLHCHPTGAATTSYKFPNMFHWSCRWPRPLLAIKQSFVGAAEFSEFSEHLDDARQSGFVEIVQLSWPLFPCAITPAKKKERVDARYVHVYFVTIKEVFLASGMVWVSTFAYSWLISVHSFSNAHRQLLWHFFKFEYGHRSRPTR